MYSKLRLLIKEQHRLLKQLGCCGQQAVMLMVVY
jgi:hypothetical protein